MVLCTECKRCGFIKLYDDILGVCGVDDSELSAKEMFDDIECDFFVPLDVNDTERERNEA